MLLILFLVTSSMDTDKGLMRQLPPLDDEQQQEVKLDKKRVLAVALDEADQLTLDGEPATIGELSARVKELVRAQREDHVVTVQTSRQTSYDAYFQMQNAIVLAYNQLRDELARQRYGHAYSKCSSEEREYVSRYYPQRISESQPAAEQEGGRP